jgi:hypothetical protein
MDDEPGRRVRILGALRRRNGGQPAARLCEVAAIDACTSDRPVVVPDIALVMADIAAHAVLELQDGAAPGDLAAALVDSDLPLIRAPGGRNGRRPRSSPPIGLRGLAPPCDQAVFAP